MRTTAVHVEVDLRNRILRDTHGQDRTFTDDWNPLLLTQVDQQFTIRVDPCALSIKRIVGELEVQTFDDADGRRVRCLLMLVRINVALQTEVGELSIAHQVSDLLEITHEDDGDTA